MIPSSVVRTYRRLLDWRRRPPGRHTRSPARRLELEQLEERALMTVSGSWTQVVAPPAATGTMMLLPNGAVMAQGGGGDSVSANWYGLLPNSSGSYASGTWRQLASMSTPRLYFASNVLSNDQVFVVGGEYSGSRGAQNFINTSETYNPAGNKWTSNASFPNSQFGDDPSEVLNNGTILTGYISGPQTYTYTPSKNTWASAATKQDNDQSDEECWVKLPNGNILSYNIFSSTSTGVSQAQFYNQSTNTWTDTGTVPVQLSSSAVGYELGPALMLPNGEVFQLGANGNTALYNYQTNTWTAGPTIPNGQAADDAPAAILPDGQVIFVADTPLFGTGANLYDYDYTTNTITQFTGLPTALQSNLNGTAAYPTRMLMLPSGQLMLSSGNYTSNQLWLFTPSDSAQAAWQPTITSVTANGSAYTLNGTQLTGISEGAAYGDDAEMASNYPIVKLVSTSGSVTYARTSNWSTNGISAVGDTTSESVTFNLPASLAKGTYSLYVIANGIASNPVSFTKSAAKGPADTPTLLAAASASSTTSTNDGSLGTTTPQGSVSSTPFLLLGVSEGPTTSTSPVVATASSSSTPNGLNAFSTSLSYIRSAHGVSTASDEGMNSAGQEGQQVQSSSDAEA